MMGTICYRHLYNNMCCSQEQHVFNDGFHGNHEKHVCFPTKVVFYDGKKTKQCFNGMVTPAK